MARILVVDDEPSIVDTIRYKLVHEGHDVQSANEGNEALRLAQSLSPDMVILDLMLPGIDGLEVCRQLRRTSNVPILMLSAKGDEIDVVVGLEVGADDYMTKPFSIRELVMRVKALLRRTRIAPGPIDTGVDQLVQSGNLRIDPAQRRVTLGGQEILFRPKEFDLLLYLMQQRGRVLTRDQILEKVWGYSFPGESRTIDVHISWVREKIEENPKTPCRLMTVRGIGYQFVI